MPHLRSSYGLPPQEEATKSDYREAFEETPVFRLCRFAVMQFLGLRECFFSLGSGLLKVLYAYAHLNADTYLTWVNGSRWVFYGIDAH